MGGNALAAFGSKRVPKAVAFEMLQTFTSHMLQLGVTAGRAYRLHPVQAYHSKQDFGDLDVMVDADLLKDFTPEEVVAYLSGAYGAELPFVHNGSVLSVGLPLESGEYLQAVLLATPAVTFDFAASYLAWNNLGNFVGRVAAKLGLKFGTRGLTMPMRDGGQTFAELVVTLDFKRALTFLGFDGDRWARGFEITR